MATPIIDPSKTKFFPEMLIEALNEPTITTAEAKVASYNWTERRCIVENIEPFTQTANCDLIVMADSVEKARIRSDSVTLRDVRRKHKIAARETLDISLQMTAGAAANVRTYWNMTFRRPLPVDKIREGKQLDTNEDSIAQMTNLEDYLSFGAIPYHQSLMNIDPNKIFEEVIPVEKVLTAIAANGESIIGGQSIPANDQLLVLLGIMVDTTNLPATPSDTFFCVDRDIDANYMRLDCSAMPDNVYIPCYVPATKKIECRIESATGTGVNTVDAGFVYGVRPLSIADHIAWGLEFKSANDRSKAQALVTKYPTLAKRIQAGLI